VSDADLTPLSDAELEQRVRALLAEMAPREQELAALRSRLEQLATEQRRRDRARHRDARMHVRSVVAEGQMASLEQAVADATLFPDDLPLTRLHFFRDSGTQVGLGYATAREPTLYMTDGERHEPVRTLAEARIRYRAGWEFGTAQHAGVRIHIPNTRTEKVLPAAEVFVKLAS
jgi:nucleoside 2-deoxyribosyltransferase